MFVCVCVCVCDEEQKLCKKTCIRQCLLVFYLMIGTQSEKTYLSPFVDIVRCTGCGIKK